jgi:hypothetical protein
MSLNAPPSTRTRESLKLYEARMAQEYQNKVKCPSPLKCVGCWLFGRCALARTRPSEGADATRMKGSK